MSSSSKIIYGSVAWLMMQNSAYAESFSFRLTDAERSRQCYSDELTTRSDRETYFAMELIDPKATLPELLVGEMFQLTKSNRYPIGEFSLRRSQMESLPREGERSFRLPVHLPSSSKPVKYEVDFSEMSGSEKRRFGSIRLTSYPGSVFKALAERSKASPFLLIRNDSLSSRSLETLFEENAIQIQIFDGIPERQRANESAVVFFFANDEFSLRAPLYEKWRRTIVFSNSLNRSSMILAPSIVEYKEGKDGTKRALVPSVVVDEIHESPCKQLILLHVVQSVLAEETL